MTYLDKAKFITVGSRLAEVGVNPEMADMDNPRGVIVQEVFFLMAESEYGYRFIHNHSFGQDVVAAEALCIRVQNSVDSGNPLNPAHWSETRPRYGSEAYDDEGCEQMEAQMERMEG